LYRGLRPTSEYVPGIRAAENRPSVPTVMTRETWVRVFVTCTNPGSGRGVPGAGPPTASSLPLTLMNFCGWTDEEAGAGIELDGFDAAWPELVQLAVAPTATIANAASAVFTTCRRCQQTARFAIRPSAHRQFRSSDYALTAACADADSPGWKNIQHFGDEIRDTTRPLVDCPVRVVGSSATGTDAVARAAFASLVRVVGAPAATCAVLAGGYAAAGP
jgi:hypothetical protein